MNEENQQPAPHAAAPESSGAAKVDPAKSETVKSAAVRRAQVEAAKKRLAERGDAPSGANPLVGDETYGELREANRVVMRNQIALNLDSFRAAPAGFAPRPERSYPPLREAAVPFFSVIIPNYNGERLLPAVLDALAAQTFGDFETLVVDDASSDDSVALVERGYPHVRLLVNRRNLGFVRSCNLAADTAGGRVLVLLNSDTEPEPGWLAELARAVCANPYAAMIASKLLLHDRRDTLHAAGDTLGVDGIPRNRGVWRQDHGQYDGGHDGGGEPFGACGGAAAYRRDVWEALGGFDEDFWMYLEDADYAFRAQLMGHGAAFAPQARVYHRLSASGGDALSSYYVGRNTIWNIAKNMPAALLAANAGAIVAAQARIAWDALRNVRGAAARARLRGQLAGLLGLPAMLGKRRLIQARRRTEDAALARKLTPGS